MCRYGAPPTRQQLAVPVEFGGDSHRVGGLASTVEIQDHVIDVLVGGPVEVPGTQLFQHVGDRVLAQQHPTQHRLLGVEVLRGLAAHRRARCRPAPEGGRGVRTASRGRSCRHPLIAARVRVVRAVPLASSAAITGQHWSHTIDFNGSCGAHRRPVRTTHHAVAASADGQIHQQIGAQRARRRNRV